MESQSSIFPMRVLIVKTDEEKIIECVDLLPENVTFRILEINYNPRPIEHV